MALYCAVFVAGRPTFCAPVLADYFDHCRVAVIHLNQCLGGWNRCKFLSLSLTIVLDVLFCPGHMRHDGQNTNMDYGGFNVRDGARDEQV
jgi:hypothetical protein